MQQFYVRKVGKPEQGPVNDRQLLALVKSGDLQRLDLVRLADSDDWLQAEKVNGLFPPAPPRPVAERPAKAPHTDAWQEAVERAGNPEFGSRRKWLRGGASILRILLFLGMLGAMLSVVGGFMSASPQAAAAGFGSIMAIGLALVFCRACDVVADISELLDR